MSGNQQTIRIDLGDGQFADVLDPSELRDGDRVAVNGSYKVIIDPETNEASVPGDRVDRMRRALLCRVITGWNLQWKIPSQRPDSLDKLTFKQAAALRRGTDEHFRLIMEEAENAADPTGDASSDT